jgi:hypothetical protein
LILDSASLDTNLAFTTIGCGGSWPLPSTWNVGVGVTRRV